ncbi:hypothetical protein Taro_048133 [Colocasia esculenta]|uniref:Uncharacterized protein n=1 Tax=Colocasia esculenta TaxID=4460 RepID=A0A843X780_COLES|nr:hypothetical protein [Colocasia esculenta]
MNTSAKLGTQSVLCSSKVERYEDQQPQTTNCGVISEHGVIVAEQGRATMDASSTLSASPDDRLWRHEMTVSMKAASQGRVIGPAPGSPNTSSDILRSSAKMSLLRYASGTSKRCPLLEYTTKQPFLAGAGAEKDSDSSAIGAPALRKASFFLPAAAAFIHFLAIWASLLELIMVIGL